MWTCLALQILRPRRCRCSNGGWQVVVAAPRPREICFAIGAVTGERRGCLECERQLELRRAGMHAELVGGERNARGNDQNQDGIKDDDHKKPKSKKKPGKDDDDND